MATRVSRPAMTGIETNRGPGLIIIAAKDRIFDAGLAGGDFLAATTGGTTGTIWTMAFIEVTL